MRLLQNLRARTSSTFSGQPAHQVTDDGSSPVGGGPEGEIVVAMLLRPQGETGVQTHVQELLAFLDPTTTRCTVVTPFSANPLAIGPVFGARLVLTRLNGSASVWWYRYWHAYFLGRALRRQLRPLGPCVIYAQCPVSAAVALRVRRTSAQKVALAVHFNRSQADEWAGKGVIPPTGRQFAAIRRFEADVIPRVDRLIFVSAFMRDHLQAAHPSIRDIPSAVVHNYVTMTEAPRHVGRTGDLISIGTLEPRKNQRFLIEVLAAARDLGHRYRLTLVGSGPDRKDLVRLAAERGLVDAVAFAGRVDRARTLLPGHRVYVHAANAEAFGIVMLEALAAGLPIFAPPLDGMREIIRDGQEGWFWSLDDPVAAAVQLIRVLEDQEAWTRASTAALERYETCFSPAILGPQLVEGLGLAPAELR